MTYLKDSYKKFLNNSRDAPLAANVSLIYVPTTTRIDGADAVKNHVSRQARIVKKTSEQVINAIESSDALCLDIEVTLTFVEGGGAYLPAMDDNFLMDRVATIPTLHIVQFNTEQQIQQVRIYWDQASLLKAVEVIGKSGRAWPICEGKDQTRLLKNAATAKFDAPSLAPSQSNNLPPRPASPGKRHIKDPYAADSLFDLLSPNKEEAPALSEEEIRKPADTGKRHTRDPYAAGSLTELLSPSKPDTSQQVRPYGGAQPAARPYGDLFVGADDDEMPGTPSKAERVVAPKAGSKFQGNRIFQDDDKVEDRAFYKSDPKKYDHFEIGADNADREVKEEPKRGKSRHQSQWDFGDFTTPVKPSQPKPAEESRPFGYDTEETGESPPARPAVHKPRRDADVHFGMTDDDMGGENDRIISSFGNRGNRLYENRLFGEENGDSIPSKSASQNEPLGVTGNNASRKNNFDVHWQMSDISPAPSKFESENVKTMPADRAKSIKQMEASWDQDYDVSPDPIRPATHLHNPKGHNQPSWTYGDE